MVASCFRPADETEPSSNGRIGGSPYSLLKRWADPAAPTRSEACRRPRKSAPLPTWRPAPLAAPPWTAQPGSGGAGQSLARGDSRAVPEMPPRVSRMASPGPATVVRRGAQRQRSWLSCLWRDARSPPPADRGATTPPAPRRHRRTRWRRHLHW